MCMSNKCLYRYTPKVLSLQPCFNVLYLKKAVSNIWERRQEITIYNRGIHKHGNKNISFCLQNAIFCKIKKRKIKHFKNEHYLRELCLICHAKDNY